MMKYVNVLQFVWMKNVKGGGRWMVWKNIYLLGTQAFTESLRGHEVIKKILSICGGMQMFCKASQMICVLSQYVCEALQTICIPSQINRIFFYSLMAP